MGIIADDKFNLPEFRLELSVTGVKFLRDLLPRLSKDDPHYDPITLDLNGHVLVRAREAEKS